MSRFYTVEEFEQLVRERVQPMKPLAWLESRGNAPSPLEICRFRKLISTKLSRERAANRRRFWRPSV